MLRIALGDEAPAAAERLLQELASLRNVVNADIERLTSILNGQRLAAQLVVAAKDLIEASFTEALTDGPICASDKHLLTYLGRRMKGRRQETLLALFADQNCHFIREEELGIGSAWSVAVRPRTLFGRALALDARSILLVHNHPSGEARASESDINSTRHLVQQAKQLDIFIIDHLIVGGSQIYSMKKGRNW
ncbi:JAB domain-containing protein [Allopontixanthobacter sediminis]|uniref:JAB domain-containing protein n=1 Tax=Allopontixanthobacter sediminis TaxID=1689985 RepID=UPI0019264ECB|nr:JAB domain-containing protein [Allopontixanthobacter sediminis]